MSDKILLSEEEQEQIEKLSGAGYLPDKIAVYLGFEKKKFLKAWEDRDSVVRYRYDRGLLLVDAMAGMKLAENAMSGNITAHQQLEKIRKGQLLSVLKKKYLYGEEIDGL